MRPQYRCPACSTFSHSPPLQTRLICTCVSIGSLANCESTRSHFHVNSLSHCILLSYRVHKSDEASDVAAETAAAASHAEEAMQVDASASVAGVGAAVATELGRAVATSETSSAVGGWRVEEVGPSLDLVLRRTHLPAADLWKRACHTPKPVRVSSTVVMQSGVLLNYFTVYILVCSLLVLHIAV